MRECEARSNPQVGIHHAQERYYYMKNAAAATVRIAIRVLVLVLIFIASGLFFSRMINQVTPDAADHMAKSSFPLVYMRQDDMAFNCLHGFAQEMDTRQLRDSITPLNADRTIGIRIQTFTTNIDSITYQIKTIDGQKTLEDTSVIKTTEQNGYIDADLQLQSEMLMNQEYVMQIHLQTSGRDIYYYTHVLLADGLHTKEYLNYVSGFYDKLLNKTDLNTIAAAVEPDETTDNEQTLAFMDIHDSVNQLTWADLKPQIYYRPTPKITEINGNTATLNLEYRISSVNESGKTEVFNVNEDYRVRFTDSRVFLLNYQRNTDELFNPDNNVLSEKGIRLGITGKDVEYKADVKQRVIAFVQANVLWTYENSTGRLNRVFGFPQDEDQDYRDFYNNSSIQILKVESNGNIWFTVAGYMNRGDHEGENGVSVCYFEAATDTVDERIFISTNESPVLTQRDAERMTYVKEDGSVVYVLLNNVLYKVDLNSRQAEAALTDIHEDCYAASTSGRYFAYLPEGNAYASTKLIQMDLVTGATNEVDAPAGDYICPITYMGEDLVYGMAHSQDLAIANTQTGLFPMYRLGIIDGEGSQLKDYQPQGVWIMKVEQSDNMLALTRAEKNADGTAYITGTSDQIVNTDTAASVSVGVATAQSSRKQNEVYLRTGSSIRDTEPQVVSAKIITYDKPRSVRIENELKKEEIFDVYAMGKLYDRYALANEAVTVADSLVGVVIDGDQNYTWVRGDKEVTADIDLSKVPAAMAMGSTDAEEISGLINRKVINLTGCTLEQVLYYVSHGKPVIGMTTAGPVTIVGYDEYNTHLVDPKTNNWYYFGINDSTAMFEAAGNVFLTYTDTGIDPVAAATGEVSTGTPLTEAGFADPSEDTNVAKQAALAPAESTEGSEGADGSGDTGEYTEGDGSGESGDYVEGDGSGESGDVIIEDNLIEDGAQ